MLLKLKESNEWTGAKIGRTMIKEMVQAYRDRRTPKVDFNYAHFTVDEIIQLFVDNKIIEKPVFLLQDCGLKIYMGNHHESDNCPIVGGYRNNNYLHYNTPILCNTIIKGDKYHDMLGPDNAYSIIGDYKEIDGYGLDQSVLCPPDCFPGCEPDPNDPKYCTIDIGQKP